MELQRLMVVLYHFYLLSNSESSLYSFGKIWAAGHEAVILFFVLSQLAMKYFKRNIYKGIRVMSLPTTSQLTNNECIAD